MFPELRLAMTFCRWEAGCHSGQSKFLEGSLITMRLQSSMFSRSQLCMAVSLA